jgi:signal transduction histidine kinase
MPIRAVVRRSNLPAGLRAALALTALTLLTLIGLQGYQALSQPRRLASDAAWVSHTFEVIESAQRLRSITSDAERAQRGYLLTGTPAFLEAYETRIARSRELLEQFRKLTADNPEQQRRIPNLVMAIDDWVAERRTTIEVYQQQGSEAAVRLVRPRASLDTLRTVDALIEAAIANERDLLIKRQQRAEEDQSQVRRIALITGALGTALLAVGVWLTVLAFHNARAIERQRRDTEEQLSEQLLNTQAALAQTQKMEALGQLTGGVAHDFNNVLHVMTNAVSLLQLRLRGADGEIGQYLEMIKRNTERAASTTARLLAFARQQALDPKPTDLNKVVAGMAELLTHLIGENVAMETVLGGGLWAVTVDRNQLETAIVNLAVNARDAMPESGKLTIETSNTFLDEAYAQLHPEVTPGQYTMIAVSDTGVGMAREIVTRAFDPFFTTKEAGQGTGLGLSQVFGFVKQSGGHVKIYSELRHGSTVKMYFPRLMGAHVEPAADSGVIAHSGTGESILLVEDNDDVRSFTADVLRQLGYRVTTASDGKGALATLEKLGLCDLLFTDIGLPLGMTGRELAEEAQRRWPQVRVLYTTGYARNSIVHHGRLDPGVELLLKPFTQASLAAKVRRVLDKVR